MDRIGLFGSLAVLVTLIPGPDRAEAAIGREPAMVLAMAAWMVLTYALIVVALVRAKNEFSPRLD